MFLDMLEGLATAIYLAWALWLTAAGIGRSMNAKHWNVVARMHQELWPVAFPGIVWSAVDNFNDEPWMLIFNALSFIGWWAYRDWPDENPWKKRGRKAKETIVARGGKLVIVPASN